MSQLPDPGLPLDADPRVAYQVGALRRCRLLHQLLDGRSTLRVHVAREAQLCVVYEALDECTSGITHPGITALLHDQPDHLGMIRRRLSDVQGPNWRSAITPLPTTERYVEHLRRCVLEDRPAAFLGHHYARYTMDSIFWEVVLAFAEQDPSIVPEELDVARPHLHVGISAYQEHYRRGVEALELTVDERLDYFDGQQEGYALGELLAEETWQSLPPEVTAPSA